MDNFKKQAKSDIFKELHPIISFYINKGAKPKSLKKYYKNSKRFRDLLEDIKNKGINLVNEDEYEKLVREILYEILEDFIAKDKDEEYKNKQNSKMKHIKEFNSYEPVNEPVNDPVNEDLQGALLLLGSGYFFYRAIKGFLKSRAQEKENQRVAKMTPQELDQHKANLYDRYDSTRYNILNRFIKEHLEKGGQIKFSEDYVNYVFIVGDLTIKINKFEKTIRWNRIEGVYNYVIKDKENFEQPIKISQEDIDGLVKAAQEDIQNNQE